MEGKVQKNIIDYFSFLEEFYNRAKTCLKICQTCAISINKLIYRCKNINESNLTGSPLEKLTDLKAKLLTSLHNLISIEIQEIQSQLSIIEELFEKLCYKNKTLQDSCKDIDLNIQTALVKGTPLQPPLSKLLAFASDGVTFGSQVYAQIDTALNILSFKGLNTKHLTESFKFPADWQKTVPEIIAYTSFCAENEI